MKITNKVGADPEIFERGDPEAIIYKILERGGPKSVKMVFECLFQSFSYKCFANIPPKGGGPGPQGPSPTSATARVQIIGIRPHLRFAGKYRGCAAHSSIANF